LVLLTRNRKSENTALAVPVKPSENASKKPKKAKVSQQADVNTATVSKEASPAAGSTTSKKQKASESVTTPAESTKAQSEKKSEKRRKQG